MNSKDPFQRNCPNCDLDTVLNSCNSPSGKWCLNCEKDYPTEKEIRSEKIDRILIDN